MDSINLDPNTYSGTYKLIGGEVCLDFINTISWPDSKKTHDWLSNFDNFIAWAQATDIIKSSDSNHLKSISSDRLQQEMDFILQVRKNLTDVIKPLAFGEKPTRASIERINELIHQTTEYRLIDCFSFNWVWKNPKTLVEAMAPVIWNTGHVLVNSDHSRIKHCGTCHWLFYDTSRNHSRKWCDMEDCGSRDKALRYYHRQK